MALNARARLGQHKATDGSVGAVVVQVLTETAGLLERYLPDDNTGQQIMQHLELAAQAGARHLSDTPAPDDDTGKDGAEQETTSKSKATGDKGGSGR